MSKIKAGLCTKKDVKMPRGENDAAKSRGSALSFVISMLHRMMTTLLRWEAVFRRERMPVSIDRLPYSDPERGTVHFYVEYMVLRLWKRCCRTDVS